MAKNSSAAKIAAEKAAAKKAAEKAAAKKAAEKAAAKAEKAAAKKHHSNDQELDAEHIGEHYPELTGMFEVE